MRKTLSRYAIFLQLPMPPLSLPLPSDQVLPMLPSCKFLSLWVRIRKPLLCRLKYVEAKTQTCLLTEGKERGPGQIFTQKEESTNNCIHRQKRQGIQRGHQIIPVQSQTPGIESLQNFQNFKKYVIVFSKFCGSLENLESFRVFHSHYI